MINTTSRDSYIRYSVLWQHLESHFRQGMIQEVLFNECTLQGQTIEPHVAIPRDRK